MQLNNDLSEFIALLNSGKVEYLVVGAFAVAWHGHPRFTSDIDLWVRSSDANAVAIVDVLDRFGFGSLGIEPSYRRIKTDPPCLREPCVKRRADAPSC